MDAAFSLLAVNFVIAQIFVLVFGVVALKGPSRRSGLGFAAAFAIASLSAVCEALIPLTGHVRFFAIGAFVSMFGGFCLLARSIARHYGLRVPSSVFWLLFVSGVFTDFLIYDLPRGSVVHSVAYQTPFFLAMALSAFAVYGSGRRSAADLTLFSMLALSAAFFPFKAYVAVKVGAGETADDYLLSKFALVSQGFGAVLIVAAGLAMVGVFVKEAIEDAVAKADIDPLSGIFNRRGFARRVAPRLERENEMAAGALILADIDHFKRINDNFGHHVGDIVIQTFARVLREAAPSDAEVARIGGEEFAIYIPAVDSELARECAHNIRGAMSSVGLGQFCENETITASFGVASIFGGDTLERAMQRADTALYAAKAAGRDQVQLAGGPQALAS
ncbi:diguanylate cyclase [Ciceribacter sp. RN22]|uniref:GGDEF domain-containing protein n=1 Tax=Ciceribacter sp. RN22 TaxID=2954932 RepID=UPI002092A231|nr:GGDEF domain-containing protein [Ciceribacter sp. RN22]MCO6178514.1 GGDEF domain-containing protein [Ciceribacter sp. RN22]